MYGSLNGIVVLMYTICIFFKIIKQLLKKMTVSTVNYLEQITLYIYIYISIYIYIKNVNVNNLYIIN